MSKHKRSLVLTLPDPTVAGHIIGKKGSQINLLRQLTKCNIQVEKSQVRISGRNSKQAADLIHIIINNAICVYEHPKSVYHVWNNIRRDECGDRFKLDEYSIPYVQKLGKDRKYYILKQCPKDENGKDKYAWMAPLNLEETMSVDKDSETTPNEEFNQTSEGISTPPQVSIPSTMEQPTSMNDQESDASLSEKPVTVETVQFIYSPSTIEQLIEEGRQRVASSFIEMARVTSSLVQSYTHNKILIKMSLGKKTFYDAKRNVLLENDNKIFNFQTFTKLQIGFGKDIKSTWRNEIDYNTVQRMRNYMLNNGWKLEQVLKSVSCYVVEVIDGILDRNGQGGKRFGFKVVPLEDHQTQSFSCKLVKVRNLLNKLLFIDIFNVDETISKYDYRIRFQTEQSVTQFETMTNLQNYVSHLRFENDQLTDKFVPTPIRQQFRVDSFRNKLKEIYTFGNVKITLNNIITTNRQEWYEVSISQIENFSLSNLNTDKVLEYLSVMNLVVGSMN
ncbi:hypothetical protein FDP41_001172 [Naegleria fowleri]|uniref:K Homology domain-containing protein n=1 Tax=Naegleria fowleri TaxID=5763 RepID=A0A6A5C3Z0_NAEFO|nr:uncharacterized protein FDP41_001172 [Naegleria fowleri]KAF0980019.1 hypothetical protein FDP41_001172 [Naegleria fowleri]